MNFWKENRDHMYVGFNLVNPFGNCRLERFQCVFGICSTVAAMCRHVDVTRDGELVLIHDATVDRTTNGTGKVIVEPWVSAGVKNEEGVDKMIARGATLVTCNNPKKILSLLHKKGEQKD